MIERAELYAAQLQSEVLMMEDARKMVEEAMRIPSITNLENALRNARAVSLNDSLVLHAENELHRLQHLAEEARIAKEKQLRAEVEAQKKAVASETARKALFVSFDNQN